MKKKEKAAPDCGKRMESTIMLEKKIMELMREIRQAESEQSPDRRLPQNTFYLDDGKILCCSREIGESRYPYDCDGLVVWARSSGYIDACESLFTIFKAAHYGEDPCVNFWGGLKEGDEFFPVSVTGASRQLKEPENIKRYLVYSPGAAYYITDTEDLVFAVRLCVDSKKHIRFSSVAINQSETKKEIYLASFFESMLRFMENEGFWDRMTKYGRRYDNGGYVLRSANRGDDCLAISCSVVSGTVTDHQYTTGRSVFLGEKGRTLPNALALRKGGFSSVVTNVCTTDLPVAIDIFHFSLSAGDSARVEFDLTPCHDLPYAEKMCAHPIDVDWLENDISVREVNKKNDYTNLQIRFENWNSDRVNDHVLNRFLVDVQNQISFCALGKNYAGPHIGIRDVFQQLESSLIWQPKKSREKMVTALNYILSDGRPPRQFSVPVDPDAVPDLDLRAYIDQGVWVISTIYTYLSYTGDYSILDEICTYYDLLPSGLRKSEIKDSVLDHLVRILDFLISKIDTQNHTDCLRALYGDWNDALDGLGRTDDPDEEFGSGVTVMASLQLYQCLEEMRQILEKTGKYAEKLNGYSDVRTALKNGLLTFAVEEKNGAKRILHGWGDKRSFKIGSFCDCDGKDRISITPNAFWAISGLIYEDKSLKKTVIEALRSLDSQYGLLTLSPAFARNVKEIGRLATVLEGTYENRCAYVHASMFGIMSLFCLGESEEAWRQFEKSIVITHENCTMTPFVMPNSYCCNPDYFIDGVSMGDWYTGSGTVVIKDLVKYGVGLCPTLDGMILQTPKTLPSEKIAVDLPIKGCQVSFRYENRKSGKRTVTLNGKPLAGNFDEVMEIEKFFIPNQEFTGSLAISVLD